jgi:hypothetical protein
MTSLVGLIEWLGAGKAASRAAARRQERDDYRLRALPREDIHLFVKEMDNSRVIRLPDRGDTMASVGMTGGVLMASLLLIGMLLPGTYSMLVSHRIQKLHTQRDVMVNTLRELRVKRAALEGPAEVEKWTGPEFVAPAAGAVLFAGPPQGTVAALPRGQ